jgi:hypothetical protein
MLFLIMLGIILVGSLVLLVLTFALGMTAIRVAVFSVIWALIVLTTAYIEPESAVPAVGVGFVAAAIFTWLMFKPLPPSTRRKADPKFKLRH